MDNGNNVITPQERQEFEEYKRRKRVAEARSQAARLELDLTVPGMPSATVLSQVKEAEKCWLGGVCVQPYFVRSCVRSAAAVRVICCVSLWNGADTTDVKVRQVKSAIKDGAAAVEVTAPIPAIKDGAWSYVRREFKKLRAASRRASLRITAEAALLGTEEAERMYRLACDCGADGIRISNTVRSDDECVSAAFAAVAGRTAIKAQAESYGRIQTMTELGGTVIGSRSAIEIARALMNAAESGEEVMQ